MTVTRIVPNGADVTRVIPSPAAAAAAAVAVAPADLAVLWNAVADPDTTAAITDRRQAFRAPVAEDDSATANLDKTFVLI
jgi:hypothetical protein